MKKRIKALIIAGSIVAGLALILLITGTIVRHKIEQELARMDLGEYRLTCRTVRVNFFRRSLTLKDVHLQTRESHTVDSTLRIPIQYVDAKFDRIAARGISLKTIRNREISLSALILNSPQATIVIGPPPADSVASTKPPEDILRTLNQIKVGNIRITNAGVNYQQITPTDTLIYTADGVNLRIDEFLLDSTRQSRQRLLFSDGIKGNLRALRYTFANRAYVLALDSLDWNTPGKRISVANTHLEPQYPKSSFTLRSALHSDWTELSVKQLDCLGVDFESLWQEEVIRVDSIHFPSGHFISFKNRQVEVAQRVKPMIHTLIQQLPVKLDIRKIKLDDLTATYEELAQYANSSGSITFEHIDGTFYGFTNIVKHEDQYIECVATSQLMGKSALQGTFSLPVDPENDHFEVKATLGTTPLPILNPMVTPLTQVEIKSGQVDRMTYFLSGSQKKANVRMTLLYNDLEVSLLKNRIGGARERTGISNIINLVMLRTDNPDSRGNTRKADTQVVRDPYRSAFNYIWKGVMAGAKEIAETKTAQAITR